METDLVHSRKGLGTRVTWKRQNGRHFNSYLAYIIGAKFEQKHSNISRDILDFVIYFCTKVFVMPPVFERGKIFQKRKRHYSTL